MIPPDTIWSVLQEPMRLLSGEVHVWRASLEQPPRCLERLLATLAPDEKDRAERFHFDRDRNRFIAARGTLRAILGGYLSIEPGQLGFCYSEHGKPSLLKEIAGDRLRFNVSHSHELALFAVAEGRDLGVDLEWVRPNVDDDRIAERFFSAEEVRMLRGLPAVVQGEAFFNCWTRKEAYIKAIGEGLSMPLNQFVVSLAPGEAPALLSANGSATDDEVSRWSFRELFPGTGYKGAVVAEGHDWKLKCWDWRGNET
jgi:4'-phosphopantetheinyl transferase